MPRKRTVGKKRGNRRAQAPRSTGRGAEVAGIIGLGFAIFVVLSVISFQTGGGQLTGPLGRSVAAVFYGALGLCAYLAAAGIGWASVRMLSGERRRIKLAQFFGAALGAACTAVLVHLSMHTYRVDGFGPGGKIGEACAEVFRALISTAGTALLAAVGLVIAVVIATPLRMNQVLQWCKYAGRFVLHGGKLASKSAARAGTEAARFSGEVIRAVLPEREYDEYLEDEEEWDEEHSEGPELGTPVIIEGTDGDTEKMDNAEAVALAANLNRQEVAEDRPEEESKASKKKPKKAKKAKAAKKSKKAAEEKAKSDADSESAEEAAAEAAAEPVIVERKFKHPKKEELEAAAEKKESERLDFIPLGDGQYSLPPVSLLDYDDSREDSIDRQAMLELSAKLTKTLENYGVKGEVSAIRPGPVVTMYEFAPAPGTRLNKIVGLTDDLAMALEALRVRIVAPIPGKAAVGIEVPNKSRETVYFKEIIASDSFQKGKAKLPLALGKDIEGRPTVVDLAKMPHLLVAGTTGSGKSVSVNSMITSLLYNCSPEEVRMIMVDPKMLELSIYEGSPHLLLPVVTDPKKANLALRWAVDEMERRYELLAKMGVRDITSYNKKAEKQIKVFEAERLKRAAEEAARIAEEDLEDDIENTEERENPMLAAELEAPKKLPFIVVVIDEFADLMMCAPKEVEMSVARIAQKARAAGIHLILATQRPSVDVITGLIKANFPSRVAFHVTSKVDSRTILDQIGAEALLGAGDMLFSDRGSSPCRLHGCYVDEEEIHRIVDFLKSQGKPVYNLDILKPREEESDSRGGDSDEPVDEMYDRAVALVAETGQVSISGIQRRLRIGYNRAARIVEHMEKEGVVSPPDGTNKREVLISSSAA